MALYEDEERDPTEGGYEGQYTPGAPSAPGPAPIGPAVNPEVRANNPSAGGGGGGGGGGAYPGMNGPTYHFGAVPQFTPPPNFVPPEFTRPSAADAMNDPGYQFRAQQGNKALERSAAAKGVLRTGGTLQDLVEYGQNFASQEYGQTFNRALSSYDRQYQGATGAYDRMYQGAKDQYAPKMAQWQALQKAEQARAMAAYQREWDSYTFNRRGGGGGGGGGGGYDGEPPPQF